MFGLIMAIVCMIIWSLTDIFDKKCSAINKMIIENMTLENCHIMPKQDIDAFVPCLSDSFEGYSLFEYFSGKKYDSQKMKFFWKVVLKTSKKKIIGISDSDHPKALAFFYPENNTDEGIVSYIKAGG